MRRRALITGATGFVGGHLVERLAADGWELHALVRSTSDTRLLEERRVQLWTGNLHDGALLRRACDGMDVVFHLAAVTAARNEAEYERANVEGTRVLTEAVATADHRPRRLVYLSSYAACGPAPAGGAVRLGDPPAPLTAYGRTKLAGEEVVRGLEGNGVEVVVIRAPAVYGPGDPALLPYFRLIGRRLAPLPGKGESRLHLIFAPDLAAALEAAAVAPQGTYPVAGPGVHRWSEVVDTIAQVMESRPVRLPLPAMLVRAAAGATQAVGALAGRAVPFNREKAEEMLAPGWVCDLSGSDAVLPPERATSLREGISRTVRWYTRRGWL